MACWNCGAVPTDRDKPSDPQGLSSTDFEHLLATNDAPTDVWTPVIRDFITNGRLRLDALDAQIDILRATMDRLITEREDLAERAL